MLLIVAATEGEMMPVRQTLGRRPDITYLLTGVGPLETCLHLTRFLGRNGNRISLVMNIGVAGAFIDGCPQPLDLCLATREIVGDFGICGDNVITRFDRHDLQPPIEFDLRSAFLKRAGEKFASHGMKYCQGNFVTVNCTSGTAARGRYLRERYQAICENMEGAAVARVCQEFGLPCLEIRCISNMVEDRDISKWRLAAASAKIAAAAVLLAPELLAGE
jgi:futalosine hydrolase